MLGTDTYSEIPMDLNALLPMLDTTATFLKDASTVIGVAAVAASQLPKPAPGTGFFASFHAAVNFFAFNHGNAANTP